MKSYLNTVLGAFTNIITQLSNGDEVVTIDYPYIIGGVILCITIYWIFKIFYALIYRN